MPNLRTKTWTETTPAKKEDAQFWEDHLISDEDYQKINDVILNGGAGHQIQNSNGVDMTKRKNLRFLNAEVTDDAASETTIVDTKGEKGDKGDAGTIQVGTVRTLDPGSNATVENIGTSSNAILNFGIPKGQTGEQGIQGIQGIQGLSATIEVGTVTTLPAGQNATVENVGNENEAVFNFGIPRGQDGTGTGDMSKNIYDTNDNGIVDNSEKVNNHTVNSDVPANAKFTDTIYDDSALASRVSTAETSITENTNKITKIGNSIQVNFLLASSGWANNTMVKTTSIDGEVDSVTLGARNNINQEQMENWNGIIISDADYTNGTLTLTFKALMGAPSVDIPVAVTATRTGA